MNEKERILHSDLAEGVYDYPDGWEFTGRWRIVNGSALYLEVRVTYKRFLFKKKDRIIWVHEENIKLADILGPIQECANE